MSSRPEEGTGRNFPGVAQVWLIWLDFRSDGSVDCPSFSSRGRKRRAGIKAKEETATVDFLLVLTHKPRARGSFPDRSHIPANSQRPHIRPYSSAGPTLRTSSISSAYSGPFLEALQKSPQERMQEGNDEFRRHLDRMRPVVRDF